jgi:hypothetical protein
LKYLSAQPAQPYYLWQVETIINNFTSQGINPSDIHILLAGYKTPDWELIVKGYPDITLFFYEDTRQDKSYIPSIYFHLMAKHLQAFPELKDEMLFLHDSDIIFTKPPKLDWAMTKKVWYMSDTNSYISYDYIMSKGIDVYEGMCKVMGISKLIPKLMNYNIVGAQYIVSGEGWRFWNKVENDSVRLYRHFCDTEKDYKGVGYPIQKWTAGMWSLLWNAWIYGHPTEVRKELDFCWSTDPISRSKHNFILHNAGVTSSDNRLFFKSDYTGKLPYWEELDIDNTKCSSIYWEELKRVGNTSVFTKQK